MLGHRTWSTRKAVRAGSVYICIGNFYLDIINNRAIRQAKGKYFHSDHDSTPSAANLRSDQIYILLTIVCFIIETDDAAHMTNQSVAFNFSPQNWFSYLVVYIWVSIEMNFDRVACLSIKKSIRPQSLNDSGARDIKPVIRLRLHSLYTGDDKESGWKMRLAFT